MTKNKFVIEGMTCESCVQKITEKLMSIPHVQTVKLGLNDKIAQIEAHHEINLEEVKQSLATLPKYSVRSFDEDDTKSVEISNVIIAEPKLKTYKPLIIVFIYILLTSVAFQVFHGHFDSHLFMNHTMAGFFIGLSFFKFLDLKAFAESFSSYDPIAQRFLGYGMVYPFIELVLGLMFVAQVGLKVANGATIIALGITTYGVIKRLQSKSKFQCACLGAGFNLPLSYVTVVENLIMIAMAIYSLFSSLMAF
jgi:copper chaperone CopZ